MAAVPVHLYSSSVVYSAIFHSLLICAVGYSGERPNSTYIFARFWY